MASTYPKLLSGRVAVSSFDDLTSSRYEFLSLDQAEPNLGTAAQGNILTIGIGNTRVWTSDIAVTSIDLLSGNISNVGTISGNGNITLSPTDQGLVNVNATTGLTMPAGNTFQRPADAAVGTTRFNTDFGCLEIYDGEEWDTATGGITNQIIVANGTNTAYSLDKTATSASILVVINGVVQIPGLSYSYTVTGNILMFDDPPLPGDVIDIRFL